MPMARWSPSASREAGPFWFGDRSVLDHMPGNWICSLQVQFGELEPVEQDYLALGLAAKTQKSLLVKR
jgi:hypothetical protein